MIAISATYLYTLYIILAVMAVPYVVLLMTIIKIRKSKKQIQGSNIKIKDLPENNDFIDFMNQFQQPNYEKSNSSQKG